MQVARTAASDDATCLFFLSFKPVSLFCKTDMFGLKSHRFFILQD